jgi:hypothetical protein
MEGLGLMMTNSSIEDIKESIEFYKEIIADLENMEVTAREILAKFEQRTGRSAKEFERDIRASYAQTLNEIIALMPFMTQGNEIK